MRGDLEGSPASATGHGDADARRRRADPRARLARGVGRLARASGHGGTSLPGKLLLRIDRDALRRLGGSLPQGCVLVSATNGKTTTTALAAAIFEAAGTPIIHNVAGANMAGGVASALLTGRRDARLGVFEVDEFWLGAVAEALEPRAIVLGNLFRDQLDRYGELETIGERWATVTRERPTQLVLNADDPLIADLGRDRPSTLYFGVANAATAARAGALAHASDSTRCRRCGAAYRYARVFVGHLGLYECPACGRRRPTPAVSAADVELVGVRGAGFELRTPQARTRVRVALPGLYNVYNALAATALATAIGVGPGAIVAGLERASAVFGRGERIALGERELAILLIKNPAGANEVLRLLGTQEGAHDVLAILNDEIADGRDVSWIWDADFETLAPRVRHATCSGTRASELALRLKYAGVPSARIEVVEPLEPAFDRALARADGELYALPTYTAMLALRTLLARRGQAPSSWSRP